MNARLAPLLIALGLLPSARSSDDTTAYLVRTNGRSEAYLWKASSSGSISLAETFPMWSVAGYYDDAPQVSPDNATLVFSSSGDLWLRELVTSAERRITDAARPYDGKFSWVSIEVRGWSPDSAQLMYEIVRPDRFPRDSCGATGPPPIIRDAPYGLYRYDLKAGVSRSVKLSGEFAAWVSNKEVAAATGPNRFASPHVRVKLGSSESKPLPFPADRFCGQLAPDPDGSWLLASCVWAQKSQLMELSLRDGHVRSITEEGEFGEFQWPKFSPTGRKIAWRQQVRPPWDHAVSKLVVDSNPVFRCEDVGYSLDFRWIDDDSILCTCADNLFVVDVATGEAKGRAHTAATQ